MHSLSHSNLTDRPNSIGLNSFQNALLACTGCLFAHLSVQQVHVDSIWPFKLDFKCTWASKLGSKLASAPPSWPLYCQNGLQLVTPSGSQPAFRIAIHDVFSRSALSQPICTPIAPWASNLLNLEAFWAQLWSSRGLLGSTWAPNSLNFHTFWTQL